MRRLLLLLLPSLFHTTTLVSPFALADATAEVRECINDEEGTCSSDDTHGQDEKLCTIYLHDERTNIDGTNDENESMTETNGEGNGNKHNDNDSDNNNNNNKHKYKTIHCSEKEMTYLLEMDAKSISERDRELATLETIVKTAMEANEQNQNDEASETESLWSATVANPIWLAVMGRVYDVTAGEGFYKFGGGGYSLFAGRDASPCFATGNFTAAGAEEPIGDLDGKALAAILEWMEFYEKSDKYEYVGLLAGGFFTMRTGGRRRWGGRFGRRPRRRRMRRIGSRRRRRGRGRRGGRKG